MNTPTNNPTPTRRAPARRGAAYIVALLITTVLAALVLVFAQEMRVEVDASANHVSQTRARWIALGAIQAVRGDLAGVIALGEAPRLDQVSPRAQPLGGGLFWLIRPNYEDDTKQGYGLASEAGKIRIDQLENVDLLELPGMTEDLAAAILDWQDRNEEVTPGGAESAYYLSRDPSYNIKNRPLETIGELLYLRGMTPKLLYGEDANRNGVLDPNEDDGDENAPNDNGDGRLDRGFIDMFTIYSIDPALGHDGSEKTSVDIDNPNNIEELAGFLRAQLGEERGNEVAQLSQPYTDGNSTYDSILDFYVKTKLTEAEFELIHDGLKRLDDDDEIPGVIDVYHASPEVIDAMPGMDAGDGQAIVDARPTFEPDEPIGNIAWVVDVLGAQKAAAAGRFMTASSYQFAADIVAISGDGRGFCRLRVVLDCLPVLKGEATLPTVVLVEDLTALGWPLDEEVREQLRSGATADEVSTIYSEDTY